MLPPRASEWANNRRNRGRRLSSIPDQAPRTSLAVRSVFKPVKIPELYNLSKSDDGSALPINTIPLELMEYLLFEQVGGQELLLLSRSDIINGQFVNYAIINNLLQLSFDYSSGNILYMPGTIADIFKQFGIVIENYVPDLQESEGNKSPNAYLDSDNESAFYNSLVIEFKNIQSNMSIEVQVLGSGSTNYTGRGLAE